jgi:hypothetical protein
MQEYEVYVTEAKWYSIVVTAESAEDAEKQAIELAFISGFDEFEFEGSAIEQMAHVEELG